MAVLMGSKSMRKGSRLSEGRAFVCGNAWGCRDRIFPNGTRTSYKD